MKMPMRFLFSVLSVSSMLDTSKLTVMLGTCGAGL
jgi:hypothetical protein